jgi:hypothetical protein
MGKISKALCVCLAISMFAIGVFGVLFAGGERALEFKLSGSFWGFAGGVMFLLFFVDHGKKMQLSLFLTALSVPVSWLILMVFASFQKPPLWAVDAVFILPVFLFSGLYLKGISILREKIGASYIASRMVRVVVGIVWSIINSLIGMFFGVLSIIVSMIGFALGSSYFETPGGHVWTSTPTTATGYILGIVFLVIGFVLGFVVFRIYGDWANRITLRTLGTSIPMGFGIMMLIVGVVLTIEEMIFGGPLLYNFLHRISPLV